ncbi:hypothetical protein V6N12_058715 [Hibiscus sabdariffa]|uniref:Uncharacterized protein n=1 Tax=Hibiscus sabdariffa TaxID=183260 RepID=A0ABR2ESY7_9ROSI
MSNPSQRNKNLTFNLLEGSCGRPPDTIVDLVTLSSLEQPRSPISKDFQRDPKKGKNQVTGSVDHGVVVLSNKAAMDVSMLDVGDKSTDVVSMGSGEFPTALDTTVTNESLPTAEHGNVQKPSFKEILAGTAPHQTVNGQAMADSGANGGTQGSRYNIIAALDVDDGIVNTVSKTAMQISTSTVTLSISKPGSRLVISKYIGSSVAETSLRETAHGNRPPVMAESRDVASKEVVVPVQSSLNKANHTAIRVVDSSPRPTFKEFNGRVLPASITTPTSKGGKTDITSKGMVWNTVIFKKKSPIPPNHPSMHNLVGTLSSELNDAQASL